MSVSTLTAQERQTKLETLAAIDTEVLAATTVRELRKLVAGVIQNVSKLPKSELLDIIADRTADIREANRIALETAAVEAATLKERNAELEASKLSPATPKGYRAAYGISNNQETVENVKTELDYIARNNEGFADLCDKVDTAALKYSLEQSVCYEPKSRKANNTELYGSLNLWLENLQGGSVDDDIKTTVLRFKTKVSALSFVTNKSISTEYRDSMKPRIDGLTKIVYAPLLQKAVKTLEDLQDHRDVAIALALVTGRRMGELMAVGRFALSEKPSCLSFSGQSKTRGTTAGNELETFDIPVLASPELILHAIWYLETGGYRLDNIDDVNKKYSKSFSRKMVEWSEFAGVPMTFKSLRALYGSICYKLFAAKSKKESSYLSEVLGHGEKDITTSFSYMIWDLVDG